MHPAAQVISHLDQPPGHGHMSRGQGTERDDAAMVVLDTTRPGKQTEMTPESNCFSHEPRI